MKASVPYSAAWETRLKFCFKKKTKKSYDIVFIFPLLKYKVKQSLRLELSYDAT